MSFSRGWRDVATTGAVTAFLALFWWLSVSASIQKSHTSDELPHITAGYAYNQFGDFRMHPENGVLPQRLFGSALFADNLQYPFEPLYWRHSSYWQVGWDVFYSKNNLTDWIVLRARAVNAALGVAIGAMIFILARQCFGRGGGLLALGFYTLAPNFLAHAGLATSDIASSFFIPLAALLYWHHLSRRDFRSGMLAGIGSGLALASKFNGVLLLPIYTILAIADATFRAKSPESRWRRAGTNFVFAALHGVAAMLVLWAFFNFRFSPQGPGTPEFVSFAWAWEDMFARLGWKKPVIELMRTVHILPDAWIYGLTNVLAGEAQRPAFFAGEHSLHGWWQFFPTLFLAKTPLAMLLALALTAFTLPLARKRDPSKVASDHNVWPIAVPAVVIGIVALTSNLNIGDRHILAVYPALFIALGALSRTRLLAGPAVALLLVQSVESFTIRPHYMASFNALAGGPTRAYRLVSDSSLDWGQDLPALREWLAKNRQNDEKLYLGYFGSAWPPHYGVYPHEFLPTTNYLARPPIHPYQLEAGIYAVSATILNEVYSAFYGPWSPERERRFRSLQAAFESSPARREDNLKDFDVLDRLRTSRLCKYLQTREPDGSAGYSILIFRLTKAELSAALDLPVTYTHQVRPDKKL